MATKLFAVGTDAAGQRELNNDFNANDWYASRNNGNVQTRATQSDCILSFATSGSWSNPGGWTDSVSIDSDGSNVPADDLKDGIDAEISIDWSSTKCVIAQLEFETGLGAFEAKVSGQWENMLWEIE